MAKTILTLAHRHSAHQVFSDFVEMAAISLSNTVDLVHRDGREARYFEIIKRYTAEELQTFPRLLAELTFGFEDEITDHLGALFHELELHNTYKGQFFSPYAICKMNAMMTFGPEGREIIEQRGFITASEPACGSGGMIIGLADAMKDDGINYQQTLHVTAVDLDIRCVHMAYIQFSLMHIPAIIVHGNTLSLEEFGHWYTPAHILGGWTFKLKRNVDSLQSAFAQSADQFQDTTKMVTTPNSHEAPKGQTSDYVKPTQLTLF